MRYVIFTFFLLLSSHSLFSSPLKVSVAAESAILMNADTGAILYEKNATVERYPASVLKIATCLYTLKETKNQLDPEIAAEQECLGAVSEDAKRRANYSQPPYWLVFDATHMGIKRGEILSLKDLVYGMMVVSADDASNIIAMHVGGTIPRFMDNLNEYLRTLGCKNTLFLNPHGLHHPKQHTTAYDMALITREALKNPLFREIVSTIKYTRPKTNKQESTTLVQTNRLLRKGPFFYKSAIGVKTGYTSDSGHNLVAAAEKNGRTLIAVVLKNKDRSDKFKDAITLFDSAFAENKLRRTLVKDGPQPHTFYIPKAGTLKTYLNEPITLDYYPSEEQPLKALLVWTPPQELPIKKGQPVGEIQIVNDKGFLLKKQPLLADHDLHSSWFLSLFGSEQGSLLNWKAMGGLCVLALLLWVAWRFFKG